MNPIQQFELERARDIDSQGKDEALKRATADWLLQTLPHRYSYHFTALGRPIIQYPQDMVAMQELIWSVRPDLIIEAGIAHGGSLILSAAMLALIDYCDAAAAGEVLDPSASRSRVLGIDIDIREHNRSAIESHPMAHKIQMIQGSSVDSEVIEQVHKIAANHERILVVLDSNHTHEHVLAELEAYAPLTSQGSYCIVFDTVVEDLPADMYPDRPWAPGNNPKTAVWAYLDGLRSSPSKAADGAPLAFDIDTTIQDKLLVTVAPDGFLRRV
ncbi:cephalosporin hydroxylase family protein [Luteibacter sp.]|uniref:cephalosporin hydroxylase family protein n=1 Tax=Luteibacter sp. TaxID=1886636 RepID=UPI003F81E1F3